MFGQWAMGSAIYNIVLIQSVAAILIFLFLLERNTYNRKSCSQQGSGPLTAIVVDLTFWSLRVTYTLLCEAEGPVNRALRTEKRNGTGIKMEKYWKHVSSGGSMACMRPSPNGSFHSFKICRLTNPLLFENFNGRILRLKILNAR